MNKKLKNAVTNFIKKHSEYRDIVRDSFNFLRGIKYKIGGIGKKIDEKTILFSCFNGVSSVNIRQYTLYRTFNSNRSTDNRFTVCVCDRTGYDQFFLSQGIRCDAQHHK